MHNASKVVLGGTQSTFKVGTPVEGEIEAGLIVRQKSDGKGSVLAADGAPLGISLGKNLGGAKATSVCRAGLAVPVQLTAEFTPVVGAQVHISDTTGKAIAAGVGATGMNAVYKSAVLTGIKEDNTETPVALIDFVGGL